MSKYITEIIADVKQNPHTWHRTTEGRILGVGIRKDDISIYNYGNTMLFSVIDVEINGTRTVTTYIDRVRLERLVSWWFKSVSLKTIMQ
jgi:hypothetical protein